MSKLFNEDNPRIDPDKDYLSELVGEGKRYRDHAALAISKVHADALIDELKAKLTNAQQELQTQKRLEELLTTALPKQQEPIQHQLEPTVVKEEGMNDLTAEKIQQLVSEQLTQHEYTRKAADNVRQVQKTLADKFGDQGEAALLKIGQQVGLSAEDLQKTAQEKPQLLISLIEANVPKKELFTTPPATRLNPNLAPQNEERNWSYYQKVKSRDPKYYESDAVQLQMDKDAMRLGPSFFN